MFPNMLFPCTSFRMMSASHRGEHSTESSSVTLSHPHPHHLLPLTRTAAADETSFVSLSVPCRSKFRGTSKLRHFRMLRALK